MNASAKTIGFYIRPANTGAEGQLPPAEAPQWEIIRQSIRIAEQGGIELVEDVFAIGLTLRLAWEAMAAIANPHKENPA